MNIRFAEINIHNFLSFEEAHIDFSDYKGFVSVIGVNNNPADNAKSNGSGKCFGKGTSVMMWDGRCKNVEDIRIGDIVMGWDSTPRAVLATHSGYGHLYRVRGNYGNGSQFNNSYEYVCSENHILTLKKTCGNDTPSDRVGSIIDISIEDYMSKSDAWKSHHNQFIVPITDFYQRHISQSLPIDPYYLGLWLGDGNSRDTRITSADDEIVQYICAYAQSLGCRFSVENGNGKSKAKKYGICGFGRDNDSANHNLMCKFRELDLIKNKHIPLIYLTASYEDRMKLLAGLIDTDGWKESGYYGITQKNDILSRNILQLARSLGFKCSNSRQWNKKYQRYYNRISITGNVWDIPVLVARKKIEKYNIQRPQTIKPIIEQIDDGEWYGFQISGDGRFLLESGLVVHNSAIFDSLVWCLTGNTVRGIKDVKNLFTEGDCKVDLRLTLDGKEYEIIRTKGKSSGLTVIENGKDISGKGVRDTEVILSERLKDIDSTLIGSVILLGQGMPNRFSNNTPSGRKEVLETLSKSNFMIDDLSNRIAKRKSVLDESYQNAIAESYGIKSDISTTESQILKTQNEIDNITVIDDLKRENERLSEIYNEKTTKYNEINETYTKADADLTQFRTLYVEAKSSIDDKIKTETKGLKDQLEYEQNEINAVNAKTTVLKKEIERIKSIKDVCPTCGQKIQGVHKPDTTEQENEYQNLLQTLSNHRQRYDELQKKLTDTTKIISDRESANLNKLVDDGKNQAAIVESIKKSVNALKLEIDNLDLTIRANNTKIEMYGQSKENLIKELADLENKLEEHKKRLEENQSIIGVYERRLEIIKKFSTAVSRDFRGILLEDIIAYLNKVIAKYSDTVFGHRKCSLVLDKNALDIIYCDKQYESLSGGERQKVDVIIQFALRYMLCSMMNFSSNIIVLDEVFDNCDAEGCDRIIKLISTELSDIESVFIITHHNFELQLPTDCDIMVTKDGNNISRIV